MSAIGFPKRKLTICLILGTFSCSEQLKGECEVRHSVLQWCKNRDLHQLFRGRGQSGAKEVAINQNENPIS
jgi:hypothetical protein